MRIVIVLLALAGLTVLVALAGILLPEQHVAVVEARLAASPEAVYAGIHDVGSGAAWRSGLEKVETLSAAGEPLRWRETADWGALTVERVVDEPSRRVVHRIIEEGQGFGGTWTWEIESDGKGTLLRITEDGTISNPLFRLLSKFVFGQHSGIETYARDLGRRLGEAVEPYRPTAPDPDAPGSTPAASTAQAVDSGFASAPDSAWVTLTGTAIVAFYPVVSNDSLEADEGLATAFDDLSYHLGSAMDSLLAAGVSVEYRGGDTIWLSTGSRRLRFVRPPDRPTVGYVFADTLMRWTALYGVRTDMDLLEYADEFKRTGTIAPR